MLIIIIMNILIFIASFLSKKDSILYEYSKVITYLIFVFIIGAISQEEQILALVATTINISSLFYLANKTNSPEETILVLIINYILISKSIFNLDIESYKPVLILLITSIETLLIRFKILIKDPKSDLVNQVIYSISALIMYFTSISSSIEEICVISNIFLIINLISAYDWHKDNSNQIFYYLQPVSIMFVILSGAEYIDIHYFDVTFAGFSLILSVIYCFMNLLIKEEKLKKEYFISLVALTIISSIVNLYQDDFLLSVITVITPAYIFSYSYFKCEDKKELINSSFIYLLLSIYLSVVNNQIISDSTVINNLIVIWVYCVFLFLLKNNTTLNKLTNIALVIPMYNIVEYTNFSWSIKTILTSLLQFYVLYLILRFFCKTNESKNIVSIIGILIVIFQIMFINGLLMGIYVGIVGIVITMIGFYKKEYHSLFALGLIITIVNIIYQLADLWEKIPFWLYLLVCGLGIIGFVTYKEMKKMNK